MSKYYTIIPTNIDEFEIRNSMEKVIGYVGNEKPLQLDKIRKKEYEETTKKGFIIKHSVKNVTAYYYPVVVICEYVEHPTDGSSPYFVDIITGKIFRTAYEPIENPYKPSKYMLVKMGNEVPTYEVYNLLKSLSNEDIKRYKDAIDKLDECMQIGYENYLLEQDNAKKRNKEYEEYIQLFTKKYRR